jgi:AraC family transcriptional regulator
MASPKQSSRQEYELRINRAMEFVRQHLDQDLNLDSVSQAACFSPFHFHRIFYALRGETVHDFIWRVRLEKSAKMLGAQPDLSITGIALECGFSSPSNFAKAFKKYFGMSATRIRGKLGTLKPKGKAMQKKPRVMAEDFKPEVRVLPQTPIAFYRIYGYNRKQITRAFKEMENWAQARGLFGQGGAMLGVFHDDPRLTDPERCCFDVAVTLPGSLEVRAPFNSTIIPAGQYVVVRYQGLGEGLGDFFHKLYYQWLPESGFVPANFPPFGFYVKHPAQEKPAGLLVLDVCMPIKPL